MRSAFQILKDSFSKITSNPKVFLSIIAIPALIAAGASFIEPATDIEGNYIWNSTSHMVQYIAVMVVFSIVSLFMSIAAILASENSQLSAKEAYSLSLKKAIGYIAMAIASTVVIILGFILLIIPGIWLSVSLMFAGYYLVLRNTGATESLKMSFALVKGRWWKVFLKALMFGLLYILFAIPVYGALWFLGTIIGSGASYAIESAVGVLGSLVTIVFMYEFFTDLEKTKTMAAAAPAAPVATPTATV